MACMSVDVEHSSQPASSARPPLPDNWKTTIAIIWIGQAFSILLAYSAMYAGIWYVTETTDSALMLAAASLCSMIPQGVLSPIGGMAADRFNRKFVMIASDTFVGTSTLVMAFIVLFGHVSVGIVLVMGALRAIGEAFHVPAMESTTPLLVPEEHLVRVNTLNQSLWSLASIVGPVFGIFLYTTLGFQTVLFLSAFGSFAACVALLIAKIPAFHDESEEARHPVRALKAGVDAVRSDRGILVMAAIIVMVVVAYVGQGTLFPLMTYDVFSGDGYMASLVEAAYGASSLIGAAILFAWGGGRRLVKLMAVAGVGTGVIAVATGLLRPGMFMWFVVLTAFSGIVEALFMGPQLAIVQKRIPPEKMGRVLGLFTTVTTLSAPIGLGISGVVAEATSVSVWFLISGVIIVVCGVLLRVLPSMKRMDAEIAATFDAPQSGEETA